MLKGAGSTGSGVISGIVRYNRRTSFRQLCADEAKEIRYTERYAD
jgi:hypothetical protein